MRHELLPRVLLVSAMCAAGCGSEVADEEVIRPDEAQQAERGVRNFERLVERYRTTHVARGAHAKGHACLDAEFRVATVLDESLRHGVFAEPGRRFQSRIRFSNGHFDLRVSADGERDARGMAIKLLAPPGEPLERADGGEPSQDFLLTNSPVFFARDIDAYNDLVAAPEAFVDYFFPAWNPAHWRLKELLSAIRTLGKTPASLLDETYFSVTPYRLGPHTVKYATRACSAQASAAAPPDPVPDDYLARELRERLANDAACFEFLVQRHRPGVGLSIEDPSVAWPESLAPFEVVASVEIAAQSPTPAAVCEALVFAPWHALPVHRPLGQFNRLRRHVYPASANYRNAHNAAALQSTAP